VKVILIGYKPVYNSHKSLIFNERSFSSDWEDRFELHGLIVEIYNFMFKDNLNGVD